MQDIINNSEVLDKLLEKMLNEQPIIAMKHYIANKDLRIYLNDEVYDIYIISEYSKDTKHLVTYEKELTDNQYNMIHKIFEKWSKSARKIVAMQEKALELIHELNANKFAFELLMPKEAIDYMLRTGRAKTVGDLAKIFKVSLSVMNIRLIKLGYIEG